MVAEITSAVTGILTALGSLIDPGSSSGTGTIVAYAPLLALPVLGGCAAFARRLVKKSR